MRGKAVFVVSSTARNGITPAYAGKSTSGYFPAGFPKDHPRLCGEKEMSVNKNIWETGSPPPMRGKVI